MAVAADLLRRSGAAFAERVYGAEEVRLLSQLPDDCLPVPMLSDAVVRHCRRDGFGQSLVRHFRLGRGAGRLRREGNMRGALLARYPILSPLLVPLRSLLTAYRVVRFSPQEIPDFLRLSPILVLHYTFYAAGFAAGAVAAGREMAAAGVGTPRDREGDG
jgi:hypothetical protein